MNIVKGFGAREKRVLTGVGESFEAHEAGRETIARRFGLERQIGEYLDYYETLTKGKG